MGKYDYDLFTIGAGSGGIRAARRAAGFGARVAIAEERDLGGTCVNAGCIPKKLFSYAAHFREDFEDAKGYGWRVGDTGFDWKTLVARKNREIARLNGVYERLLADSGVSVFRARARVVDAHTVDVAGERITAEHILIATGGQPAKPAVPGAELGFTSNEAFHLSELPQRVIVVGGGYVAVEFASIFNGLGVETTLVHRGERLLKSFDADLGRFLGEQLSAKGIRIVYRGSVAGIESGPPLTVRLADGTSLEAQGVMFATGRIPNTRDLGLERAGVELAADGAVIVNEEFRSTVPSIYAVGDVIHRVLLTPVALAEGTIVADRLFNRGRGTMDYANIPTAVFSHPGLGSVGLSEEQARRAGVEVAVYRTTFTPLKHTLSGRGEKALMKLVVDRRTDRVLGVHMVGPDAGEIIQGFAVALKCGATKRQFDATIGIHPTSAEEFVSLREALA